MDGDGWRLNKLKIGCQELVPSCSGGRAALSCLISVMSRGGLWAEEGEGRLSPDYEELLLTQDNRHKAGARQRIHESTEIHFYSGLPGIQDTFF